MCRQRRFGFIVEASEAVYVNFAAAKSFGEEWRIKFQVA